MNPTPYAPRPVTFHGIATVGDYRLKTYSIHLPEHPFDRARFENAWPMVPALLPQPAVTDARPGVGFAIMHQGVGDYFVVAWWDNTNELPVRIFVRDQPSGTWNAAQAGESFCVWDLRIMWAEREAFIATVLAGDAEVSTSERIEAYLQAVLRGWA